MKPISAILAMSLITGCSGGKKEGAAPVNSDQATTVSHPQYTRFDLQDLALTKEEGLEAMVKGALERAKKQVKAIEDTAPEESTFDACFGKYNEARREFLETLHFVELTGLVSNDAAQRSTAQRLTVEMRNGLSVFSEEGFAAYMLLAAERLRKTVEDKSEQQRFLDFVVADFRHQGLGLSADKRETFKKLQAEIAELSPAFENNIQNSSRKVEANKDELVGVDPKVVASFAQNTNGDYIIGTDYPSVNGILEQADSVTLRERVGTNFNNRAYPENYQVLERLVRARNELAQLLGYASFAEYDLANQMVGKPEVARAFLDKVVAAGQKRLPKDLAKMESVASASDYNTDHQLLAWSQRYLQYQYGKQHLNLDEAKVKEYFPVDHTLAALFSLLERQFGISVTLNSLGTDQGWDASVKVANVTYEGKYRGRVYLDLYPREGKYTHGRVMILRPSHVDKNGGLVSGLAAILTNFTAPLPKQPALFTFDEVSTLFHEFGHALHALLTETRYGFMDDGEMAVKYGLPVKTDFVELPSQMLEFWLEEPAIVQSISHHYDSGELLPLTMARALIKKEKTFKGIEVLRQARNAFFALELYSGSPATPEAIETLSRRLEAQITPYLAPATSYHFPASFLHLSSYGAKYYSYLWAQVFAADLFNVFKEAGLRDNQKIGKKYCREVLSKGGSIDPNELLESFLGRPTSPEAFFKGLEK